MLSSTKTLARTIAPAMLVLGLLFFPSLQWHVVMIDGPDTHYYGLPFPWNMDGIALSLTKDVYVLPLLIDFVFYTAISTFVIRHIELKLGVSQKRAAAMTASFYGYGLLLALLAVIVILLLNDPFFSMWYTFPIKKLLNVQIGLAF